MDKAEYENLIAEFLEGALSVEDFRSAFFQHFKREGDLDQSVFLVLDRLFGDLDNFTTDAELLRERPEFYIGLAELRARASATLEQLKESRP